MMLRVRYLHLFVELECKVEKEMEVCCHKLKLCYGFEMQVGINLGGGGSIERPKTYILSFKLALFALRVNS